MKKRTKGKLLSVILVLCILLTSLPITTMAADQGGTGTISSPTSTPLSSASFAPGSGGSIQTFTPLTPIQGKIGGLYIHKSERDRNAFGEYSTYPSLELNFPAPMKLGANSYTLQYSADNGSTWNDYLYYESPLTTGTSGYDYSFSIAPDASYKYRLRVTGGNYDGSVSNEVYAALSNVDTYFSGWGLDESMSIGGNIMTPYAGCGKTVSFDVKTLSDGTVVDGGLSYQWYRVNPVTFDMQEIAGATGLTYKSTEADAGYMLLCRATGDGITVGGFAQILSGQPIIIPNKAYITNVTQNGFRLNMFKSVAGLSPSDLQLSYYDNQTSQNINANINSVTPVDNNNAVYDVAVNIPQGVNNLYLNTNSNLWHLTSTMGAMGYEHIMEGVQVSLISINEVYCEEGTEQVSLFGAGLEALYSSNVHAEVWSGADKIADSDWVNAMWENLSISFNNSYLALNTTYTLKLYINGEDKSSAIPNGGAFTVTPVLVIDNPVTNGQENSTLTILDRGNLWSSGEMLTAKIYGLDAGGYTVSTGTYLAVNDESIIFTLTPGEGRSLPLSNGNYGIELYNASNTRIGKATFYVDDTANILKGIVRNSDNTQNVGGGIVNIKKVENDGSWSWGTRIYVLPDGKFYYRKGEMSEDANYIAEAEPPKTSSDTSGKANFSIAGGVLAPNTLTIQLQKPNIFGSVKLPDGSSAGSVPISVFAGSDKNKELFREWSNSDGAFKLYINEPGTYYIKADTIDGMQVVSSQMVEVIYNGTNVVSGIELNYKLPQLTVTAKGPLGESISGDNFDIRIEAINNKEWRYDCTRYQDSYLIGTMSPGSYKVYVVPAGTNTYAQSEAAQITVADNGTASPAALTLNMTNPKLTGYVIGINDKTFRDARVQVMKKGIDHYIYVADMPVQNASGMFSLGGIPDGQYFIRAVLYQNSALRSSFGSSLLTEVNLSNTLSTQNLILGNKSPRIVIVGNVTAGSDRMFARIINIGSISGQPNQNEHIKAEITDENGNSLSPKLEVTGGENFNIRWEWRDIDNDETDVEIIIPGGINLPAGKYKLKLTDINDPLKLNDDQILVGETTSSGDFKILQRMIFSSNGVLPETEGQKLAIQAENGVNPWTQNDTLDIAIENDKGTQIPVAYIIRTSGTLEVTLPSLSEGNYTLIIKKGTTLIAQEWILAGIPVVKKILVMTEKDQGTILEGDNLSILAGPYTSAKVYNQNNELVTSTNNVWNFWGNLALDFVNKLPVGTYTLKVWKGEEIEQNLVALPDDGQLNVVAAVDVNIARAELLRIIIEDIGANRFIQPSAADISGYAAFADWNDMSEEEKAAMAIALKNGLVVGTDSSHISPKDLINRASVAVLLYRVANVLDEVLPVTYPEKTFNDIGNVSWASEAILALARAGIVSGTPEGNFMPNDYLLTENAKILVNNFKTIIDSTIPMTGKKLTVSNAVARPGQEVELDITIEEGSGAMTGEFIIDYDASKLTPTSYTVGTVIENRNPGVVLNYLQSGKVKVQWAGTEAINVGGSVVKVKFSVGTNVNDKEVIPVTVTNIILGDTLSKVIPSQAVAGGVTIFTLMKGDVNKDGVIDAGDAVLVLRHGLGVITLTGDYFKAADVNNDSAVNTLDAGQILRYDVGLSSTLDN